MNIIIREVGEKLKELRRSLGLNQEELVQIVDKKNKGKDKPFTRNLISMVETGKSPLTKNLADTIKANLNKICDERGIKKDFDFDEICKTPTEQVQEHIDEFLTKICDRFSYDNLYEYSEELISLAEKYKLYTRLCKIYMRLGKKVRDENTDKGLEYYNRAYALKSELSNQETMVLTTNIKFLYIAQKKFNKALEVSCDFEGTDELSQYKCLYNDVLSYKNTERYDKALEKIEELKKLSKAVDRQERLYVDLLEANMFADRSEYSKALDAYDRILSKNPRSDQIPLIKCNIIEIRAKLGLEIDEYLFEVSKEDEASLTYFDSSQIYFIIGEGHRCRKDHRAVESFKKSIEAAIRNVNKWNNKKYYNKSIVKLIEIYEETSEQGFETIKTYTISGIELNLIEEKTLFRSLLYFMNIGKQDFVNDILRRKIS